MDINPTEIEEQAADAAKSRLNAMVAVTIALLASFMGVCKVKDDNIVQAMQKDQADKIDAWGYYQAKNTQSKVLIGTAEQLQIQSMSLTGPAKAKADALAAGHLAKAKEEDAKKEEFGKKAQGYEDDYNRLNTHDDQFDLSDALLALTITLLAITSLTQKKWLFWLSVVPMFFGVLMGLAGLFGWKMHPDAIMNLLSCVGMTGWQQHIST
ncbi:DUF4337 domain-containing protein [Fimbriimonas ginsengisoli]|uniref:DUF4337 domain-containing protein n=1 Tax=Fimbriimonas ginsengisoli Gsoil 348 TaxID=661478 RepID=A0A068NNG4_FIMGI|nr:DUF4337 domain-containing protein [Fimbriimonas ginsengisoli]AIE85083.1 hypothetical protein OP10G_1715 [Fimbriimonas ginsengisoli Gsoil 348]